MIDKFENSETALLTNNKPVLSKIKKNLIANSKSLSFLLFLPSLRSLLNILLKDFIEVRNGSILNFDFLILFNK